MNDPVNQQQLYEMRANLIRLQGANDHALKTISQARDRVREALAAIYAQLCEPDVSSQVRAELHSDLSAMRSNLRYLDDKRGEVGAYRSEAARYDAQLDEITGKGTKT